MIIGLHASRIPSLSEGVQGFKPKEVTNADMDLVSRAINSLASAAEVPKGMAPMSLNLCITAGDLTICLISRLSLSTTSAGTPLGADTAHQIEVMYPGSPASAAVGMEGKDSARRSSEMAKILTPPDA